MIILSEVNQTETDKYHMIFTLIFTYMWNLKNGTNEFICKIEIGSQT